MKETPKYFVGTEKWVGREYLLRQSSRSCGCLRKEELHEKYRKVEVGQVYGRLTIRKFLGRNHNKKLMWEAECSCGNVITVTSDLVRNGHTRSCGCLKREQTIKRCTKPMIGKTFGRLTVLEKMYTKKGKGAYYKCRCTCNNIVIVQGTMLRSGNTKSCGCYNKERISECSFKDLTGQRFGKLVVVGRADDLVQENGRRRVRFLCKCDCGGSVITTSSSLVVGETMSCGCLNSKGEYIIAQILSENNINFEVILDEGGALIEPPLAGMSADKCGMVAVPYEELPLRLPNMTEFAPGVGGESPLARIDEFVNCTCPKCGAAAKRETDTMPQWAGSSWYFLRYCDARCASSIIPKLEK